MKARDVSQPIETPYSHVLVWASLLLVSSTLFHELPANSSVWSKTKDLNSTKAATFALAQLIDRKVKNHPPSELPALYQPNRDRLETLYNIRYKKTNYTWSHNFDILTQTGHQWCSILRDNHACFGEKYAAILNITTPYQGHRYNLLSFEAKHERILAVGNSHLLELLYLPICATPSIFEYRFGFNTFLFQAVSTGGLTRFASARQTTLLILDNDQAFASKDARPWKTIKFLEEINFSPTIIILGHINFTEDIEELGCKERHQSYAEHFPDSRIICRCGTLRSSHVETGIADWCPGDGGDCESDLEGYRHQCVPSRGVIHGSEDLWSELIEERAFRSQWPQT